MEDLKAKITMLLAYPPQARNEFAVKRIGKRAKELAMALRVQVAQVQKVLEMNMTTYACLSIGQTEYWFLRQPLITNKAEPKPATAPESPNWWNQGEPK